MTYNFEVVVQDLDEIPEKDVTCDCCGALLASHGNGEVFKAYMILEARDSSTYQVCFEHLVARLETPKEYIGQHLKAIFNLAKRTTSASGVDDDF